MQPTSFAAFLIDFFSLSMITRKSSLDHKSAYVARLFCVFGSWTWRWSQDCFPLFQLTVLTWQRLFATWRYINRHICHLPQFSTFWEHGIWEASFFFNCSLWEEQCASVRLFGERPSHPAFQALPVEHFRTCYYCVVTVTFLMCQGGVKFTTYISCCSSHSWM